MEGQIPTSVEKTRTITGLCIVTLQQKLADLLYESSTDCISFHRTRMIVSIFPAVPKALGMILGVSERSAFTNLDLNG